MPVDLSPNFSLQELSHSDVALRRGLDNTPNAGEVANLQRLAEDLLEPVRALLGVPLHINSGFRCPSLNQALGGAIGSLIDLFTLGGQVESYNTKQELKTIRTAAMGSAAAMQR